MNLSGYINTKSLKRANLIALNGAANLVAPLSNMIISLLVVYFASQELWGAFVYILILFDIAFNIISWGNRDYLMREISKHPHQLKSIWANTFTVRLLLLFIFLIILFFLPYSLEIKIYLCVYALVRYLLRSMDVLIVFNKYFSFSLFSELLGAAIIIVPLLIFKAAIDIKTLVLLYTISTLIKSIFTSLLFRREIIYLSESKIDLRYFASSFTFLLLTFTGMLQSKTDLYSVAYLLTKKELAQYQVLVNFLGFSSFIASMLLYPFAKNIFRMNKETLNKLERKFIIAGIFISLLFITVVYIVITYFYHFYFPLSTYILAYLYIVPFYFYFLRMYEFTKYNKQKIVIIFSVLGSLLNFVICFLLIPFLKLEGALLSGFIIQCLLCVLYNLKSLLKSSKKANTLALKL